MINYWIRKLYRNVGKLTDASLKYRGSILLLSVLVIFIDPDVKITFGSASLAGLGISISPPQEFSIGLFLVALLAYRWIAFLATALFESGTDIERTEKNVLLKFEPAWEAEERNPGDMDQLVRMESDRSVYKWEKYQLIWEFLLPNAIAVIAFSVYAIKFFANTNS